MIDRFGNYHPVGPDKSRFNPDDIPVDSMVVWSDDDD